MALRDLAPQIKKHMDDGYDTEVSFNRKLADILEGRLLPYVLEKMKDELQPKAYERAKGRAPSINILEKLVKKLSGLYDEPVERTATQDADQELTGDLVKETDLNEQMQFANKLLNLNKYFALEPYIDEGKRQVRVLPAYYFSVMSTNENNPLKPDVFIKRMGTIYEPIMRQGASDFKTTDTQKVEKKIYHCYTKDEFMIMDSQGEIRDDLMTEGGYEPKNPIGEIPFVYVSNSKIDLIPVPAEDNYAMTTLVPLLLADLNYAITFQSHSIVYGIDLELGEIEGNPDSFWDMKSSKHESAKPAIGTIKPEVDIDQVNKHIMSMVSTWLDAKGIKQSSIGVAQVDNAPSGIAKMIDAGDTTESRRAQIRVMENAEKALWKLLDKMQQYWILSNQTDDRRVFSKEFDLTITYGDMKPIVDTMDELNQIKLKLELGLISEDMALRLANPDLDDAGIEALKAVILEEKKKKMEDFAASMPPESNGTIGEKEPMIPENDEDMDEEKENA